jgi:hypothetical protein
MAARLSLQTSDSQDGYPGIVAGFYLLFCNAIRQYAARRCDRKAAQICGRRPGSGNGTECEIEIDTDTQADTTTNRRNPTAAIQCLATGPASLGTNHRPPAPRLAA